MPPIPLNTDGIPPDQPPITSNPYAVDMLGFLPVRPMITKEHQLKHVIMRTLVINHGNPVNRTREEAGTWYIYWKWGTCSIWVPTDD
jgi:hypothetical protein